MAKRKYGTGHLYEKSGSYYGRWRTLDGRQLNRKVGPVVFAHPQIGAPLDRSKVTKRFKAACVAADVPPIKFHDLRHTFATRLAASGQPMRTIQEFLGHADSKTTQIYAHYAPSEREVEMVNEAFAGGAEAAMEEDLQIPDA